jgi:undecaprenyl-diphosphatase
MEGHLTYVQAVILAVIQGLTEFIPVSSTGHLVLARNWLGFPETGGLVFDVLLHSGSLAAIIIYFRKLWCNILMSILHPAHPDSAYYRRILLMLCIATFPVVIAGIFLEPMMNSRTFVRNNLVCSISMIMTGLLFWSAEFRLQRVKNAEQKPFNFRHALFIGFMQVFALIPGASRSGWTTGAGMLCGHKRQKAVEFAFLLGLPAIAGAVVLKSNQIFVSSVHYFDPQTGLLSFFISFIVSMLAIHFCVTYFKNHSLKLFAVYLWIISIIGILTC